jgi:hypothetical protein
MKKIITLSALFVNLAMNSHAQITINASDIPVPFSTNLYEHATAPSMSTGNNQSWNITTTPTGTNINAYPAETFTQWTSLGVDIYTRSSKNINQNFVIDTWLEMDHNTNGVQEKGVNISAQNYDLASFTGSTSDSIFFPEQDVFYSAPKMLMPFPMTTASKQNYASGRNVVNFTLNVPAFALNYVPCQMVYREYRKDSVVGYGSMRVYTPNGASAPYDVLMNKVTTYTIDSFYVGGAPAPAAIQNAFGIAQGQKTSVRNFYNFMRKGNFNYIARAYYAADTTFTTLDIAFTCADNVAPTSIAENTVNHFSTFAYPNPSTNSDVHLKLLGNTFANFDNYKITNQIGAIILNQKFNNTTDELVLPTSNLAKGIYFVTLKNNNGAIINEKILVN